MKPHSPADGIALNTLGPNSIVVDIPAGCGRSRAVKFLGEGSWLSYPLDQASQRKSPKPFADDTPRESRSRQHRLTPRFVETVKAKNEYRDSNPMKIREINELIERIRSGQPPELPEGKREEHHHDPLLRGLYIRLLATGVATWTLQYKSLGRQKKIALGDVRVIDRKEAIKAARELLAKITLDRLDPHKARQERMRAAKVTFKTVTPLFMANKKREGTRPGTCKYWERLLVGYYFKPLHNLPIDEITRDQLQVRIDDVVIRSGSVAAHHCRTLLNILFKWALKTGKLPDGHHNPVQNVSQPQVNGPRERVLADDEIRLIWKTCEDWEAKAIHERKLQQMHKKVRWNGGRPAVTDYPRAVRLLFLTGCRSQEIGDLQWSEVDLDNGEIKISGSRRKSKKKNELLLELHNPLSNWAVQILRNIERQPNSDYVFGHHRRVYRANPKSQTPNGQRLGTAARRMNERIVAAGGIPPDHWTPHDIRRTVRTRLAELGVPMEVAERLLGHIGHRNSNDRTYNRHEYWAEKRQALAKWEAHLHAIIDGTAEKVVRGHFGRRSK